MLLPSRSATHSRPPGFTIVELMVVISIIAILAALFVASVGRPNERTALNRAGQEVTQFLQQVRQTAIREGVPFGVQISQFDDIEFGILGALELRRIDGATDCARLVNPAAPGVVTPLVEQSLTFTRRSNPDLSPTRVFAHQPSGARQVAILAAHPTVMQGFDLAHLCFLPSGRVLDPRGRPFPPRDAGDGELEFGGVALFELGILDAEDWTGQTFDLNRRVVYGVTLSGMIEKMDPGMQLRPAPSDEEED